jgi:hypothetical protein
MRMGIKKEKGEKCGKYSLSKQNRRINTFKKPVWPGMLMHICNPSTWEATTGRSQVRSQSELQSKRASLVKLM